MNETLLRSALEADAEAAPTGAGMLVQVRRRAAVRRVRVRTARAVAVVAGLAGIAGAATLLPLGGAESLRPNPATASVNVTATVTATRTVTATPTTKRPPATPRTTVAGLAGVPQFVPPEALQPTYLPAGFSRTPFMWDVKGADSSGSWGDPAARLGVSFGPGPGRAKPQPGYADSLTWRPTTVAGQPGQEAQGTSGIYLRWQTADGRPADLFLSTTSPRYRFGSAEAHRIADGLRPGVPDWRPDLQPRLMPAGWETTGVSGNLYAFARKGRTEPRITIIVVEPKSTYPSRLGGFPASYRKGKDGDIVLRLKVDRRHEVTVYAYANPQQPSRKQVEAIALAVDLTPGR